MSDAPEQAFLAAPEPVRHWSKYRGLVADDADPAGRGRLRVRVPEVLGDIESGWASPCVPYAGDGVGLYAIPPVGAGVWVEFEAGDVSRPVWTGCWWGDGQVPPEAGSPKQRLLKTAAGHLVLFDDEAGTLTVQDSNGGKVVMDSSGIEVSAAGRKIRMTSGGVSINDGALEVR